MSQRVRVAVVGLGAVARAVHLPIIVASLRLLRDRRDLRSVPGAVTAAGERFSIAPERRFATLEQMLDGVRADALLVLTSGSHTSAAVDALDRGLAVLCEEPLAMTRREADKLAAAIGDRTDRLMLAYMKLYDPAVRRAVDLVAARPRPRAVDVTVLHPSGPAQLRTSELGPGVFDDVPKQSLADLHEHQRALEKEALGEAAAPRLGALYSDVLLGSVVHDLAVLRTLGIEIAVVDHADRWPSDTVPASLTFHGRTTDEVRVTVGWHYLHEYPAYRDRFASHVEAFEEELLAFHAMVTRSSAPAAGVPEGRADIVTCQRVAAVLARREASASVAKRPQPRTGTSRERAAVAHRTGSRSRRPRRPADPRSAGTPGVATPDRVTRPTAPLHEVMSRDLPPHGWSRNAW